MEGKCRSVQSTLFLVAFFFDSGETDALEVLIRTFAALIPVLNHASCVLELNLAFGTF